MEFCIISPIAGLERYATLSRTHLLLPQLDKYPEYRKFYQERQRKGDFLILDNGAYEGQADWKQLVDCISIYKPDVVALPDYMCQDWHKTYFEAQRFLDSYYEEFKWVQWMYIPQAQPGDIIGWTISLELMMRDLRVKWVGLARVLTYAITSDPMMRVNCARTINRMWPRIKLHALGMSKGSVEELNALRATARVNSIDSNAPVWRGWNAVKLGHPWGEISVDYETSHDIAPWKESVILHNLEACGVNTTCTRERSYTQRKAVLGSESD
jgi:hypothetical protein